MTNLDIIPIFTGTIQSYTVSGGFTVAIYISGGAQVYSSGAVQMQPLNPLPIFTSGSSSILSSSTLTSTGLKALYNGWVSGHIYNLVDTYTNIDVTITFTDGLQFSQTATSGSITFQFEYLS